MLCVIISIQPTCTCIWFKHILLTPKQVKNLYMYMLDTRILTELSKEANEISTYTFLDVNPEVNF